MDGWCTENCRLGNCPPTLCTCDCRVPTQVLVCKPDPTKFGPQDDGVKWCLNTCRAGHCPPDYCQCHTLYRQQPRPVTEGLWGPGGVTATYLVSQPRMSFLMTCNMLLLSSWGADVHYAVTLNFTAWDVGYNNYNWYQLFTPIVHRSFSDAQKSEF